MYDEFSVFTISHTNTYLDVFIIKVSFSISYAILILKALIHNYFYQILKNKKIFS